MNIYFDPDNIATIVEKLLGDSIRDDLSMYLGDPSNPDGDIVIALDTADHPGLVWVHGATGSRAEIDGEPADEDRQFVTAALLPPNRLPDEAIQFGTPVRVRRRGGSFEIVDLNGLEAVEFLLGLKKRPQRSVDISQVDLALIRPTAPASMRIVVSGFPCVVSNVAYLVPTLESDELTTYRPSFVGKAKAVMVEVDPLTNTLVLTPGAEFTNTTHAQAFASYPQQVSQGRILAGWVKVYEGMDHIVIADILHAQELLNKGGGSSLDDLDAKLLADDWGNILLADDGSFVTSEE